MLIGCISTHYNLQERTHWRVRTPSNAFERAWKRQWERYLTQVSWINKIRSWQPYCECGCPHTIKSFLPLLRFCLHLTQPSPHLFADVLYEWTLTEERQVQPEIFPHCAVTCFPNFQYLINFSLFISRPNSKFHKNPPVTFLQLSGSQIDRQRNNLWKE